MPNVNLDIFEFGERIAQTNDQEFSPIHVLYALLDNLEVENLIVLSGGDFKNLKKQVHDVIDVTAKASKRQIRNSLTEMERYFSEFVKPGTSSGELLLRTFRHKNRSALNILHQNNVSEENIQEILYKLEKNSEYAANDSGLVGILEDVESKKDPSLIVAHEGRFDLTISYKDEEFLKERVEAANFAIDSLIARCARGNMQHADLGSFAQDYKNELSKLAPKSSNLPWYLSAQRIENYRSDYVALSKEDPGEYPRLDPGFSATIDSVVVATGLIARLLPEIAKCQDDFYAYAGRQTGVRTSERKLLDAALSDLASTNDVMTPRAGAIAKKIAELDSGASPEASPEVERTVATKAGFIRSFVAAFASEILRVGRDQLKNLAENIKSKGLYDITKELGKFLIIEGYEKTIIFMQNSRDVFHRLAESWPAMFDFVISILRLLGIDL